MNNLRAIAFMSIVAASAVSFAPLSSQAADYGSIVGAPVIVGTTHVRVVPPRRYLTTYMAHYPFGVLREDYTPLGAPGVSKRDYYGVPRLTATLHVSPRRCARHELRLRRAVVTARY